MGYLYLYGYRYGCEISYPRQSWQPSPSCGSLRTGICRHDGASSPRECATRCPVGCTHTHTHTHTHSDAFCIIVSSSGSSSGGGITSTCVLSHDATDSRLCSESDGVDDNCNAALNYERTAEVSSNCSPSQILNFFRFSRAGTSHGTFEKKYPALCIGD